LVHSDMLISSPEIMPRYGDIVAFCNEITWPVVCTEVFEWPSRHIA
jgi:hypothetical protein